VTSATPITFDAPRLRTRSARPARHGHGIHPVSSVVLTYPGPADHVTGGETITLRASASDNVRVVAVRSWTEPGGHRPQRAVPGEHHVPVGVSIHVVAEAVDNLDQASTSVRDVPVAGTPPTVAPCSPGRRAVEGTS
jgi:hypothetical protein